MRRSLIKRLQRIFSAISFITVLGILLVMVQVAGYALPGLKVLTGWGFLPSLARPQVALISGHAGYDSGAVCTDTSGAITLTEAEINARISQLAARRLRRSGFAVTVLNEYDERLNNLDADLLLSLHADSCVDASGYKAAHRINSPIPDEEARLLACIDNNYGPITGLPHHPNTITHDMTAYHAFRRMLPTTPAAILEMGFLGGDQTLLKDQPDLVARAVARSVICFLRPEDAVSG